MLKQSDETRIYLMNVSMLLGFTAYFLLNHLF
jgi:hypothetical protein